MFPPAAITEELLKITEDKRDPAGLRGFDSPFYRTTETLTGTQEKPLSNPQPSGPARDLHNAVSTPDKGESTPGAGGGAGGDNRPSNMEQSWSFQPVFTPIEHPVLGQFHQSPSAPEDDVAKFGLFSPSPCKNPSLPYEALFDLALPRAASLFVGKKTSEAVHRASLERLSQREAGLEDGEQEEVEGAVSASPLEVLDRLVQQGSDVHDKLLKR